MSNDNIVSGAIEAIESYEQRLRDELKQEEMEDSTQDDDDDESDTPDSEEEIINPVSVFNLSELSLSQMDQLKVSRISVFGDNTWDWRQEGSPLYENTCVHYWDREVTTGVKGVKGVSLLDKENQYLCRLIKMIVFYSLPQNACLIKVRSFNSSKAQANILLFLGKFLYNKRKFVDTQLNGTFSNPATLNKEDFADFANNDLKSHNMKNNFALTVKHWRRLSESKLIPVEYRLDFDPFSKDEYRQLTKDMDENKGTWLPILIDDLSVLVPHCIKIIEEYSAEILSIYNVLLPSIARGKIPEGAEFKWGQAIDDLLSMDLKVMDVKSFRLTDYIAAKFDDDIKQKVLRAIRNHPEWHKTNPLYNNQIGRISNRRSLLEIVLKLGMDIDEIDRTIMYDIRNIFWETKHLVTELRNACVTILFLITGMRKSEMYLIEASDCWHVKGSEDDFRIKITVSKTSEGSTGFSVVLPIPAIGFKAFKCLESLTEKARAWGKTNKLWINVTNQFGKESSIKTFNSVYKNWSEDLEIQHIHPHQFRKTLAMFAIYQDPNNITIIRRLFSHKSLAMTLAYIVKMPGMDEEIKLAVLKQNKVLLDEILEAIMNNCIAGKGGIRIKKIVQESKVFKASLYEDGWENFEQYVEVLMQDGLNILHRTAFGAICTNTHSGLVHLGPESCNCNTVDCDWAVFTEKSIEDLDDTIKFHANFVSNSLCSENQRRFSVSQIKTCLVRLSELKGWDTVKTEYPELVELG